MSISRREELVFLLAHAPAEPATWFEPDMPPPPVKDKSWRWCEGCKADSDCLNNADCEKLRQQRRALAEWQDLREREKLLQWPLVWALEQLNRLQERQL